jgi:hypothetical protein
MCLSNSTLRRYTEGITMFFTNIGITSADIGIKAGLYECVESS